MNDHKLLSNGMITMTGALSPTTSKRWLQNTCTRVLGRVTIHIRRVQRTRSLYSLLEHRPPTGSHTCQCGSLSFDRHHIDPEHQGPQANIFKTNPVTKNEFQTLEKKRYSLFVQTEFRKCATVHGWQDVSHGYLVWKQRKASGSNVANANANANANTQGTPVFDCTGSARETEFLTMVTYYYCTYFLLTTNI